MSATNQNQESENSSINLNEEAHKYISWNYYKKIPEELCDLIVEDFKNSPCKHGTLGKLNKIDFKTRFVKTVDVPLDHWSLGLLLYYGLDANFVNFRYNVSHLAFTNFLTYEKGMFYLPHNDVSEYADDPTHGRKLTVILQLSNEDDYKGGDIILYDSNLKPLKMPREKGTIIVFNSSITHSVSKVISGIRHSLCGWMMGPPFA